ncbi:hypothetical protein ACQ4PT_043569 [Festuca glaucescens]
MVGSAPRFCHQRRGGEWGGGRSKPRQIWPASASMRWVTATHVGSTTARTPGSNGRRQAQADVRRHRDATRHAHPSSARKNPLPPSGQGDRRHRGGHQRRRGEVPEDGELAAEGGAPMVLNTVMDLPLNRSGEVAGISNKMLNALGGILLDIHSSDESKVHPANGLLIQALQLLSDTTDLVKSVNYTVDPYSRMFDWWVSNLEKDAEMICRGEGRKYIFLLNNTYDVWQRERGSSVVAEFKKQGAAAQAASVSTTEEGFAGCTASASQEACAVRLRCR